MKLRWLVLVLALVGACGDDGGKRRDNPDGVTDDGSMIDASGDPSVTLSVDPPTVSVAAGQTVGVLATIVRAGGFEGEVVVTTDGVPAGVTATAGTIAAGETTVPISIIASADEPSVSFTLAISATAEGVTIAPTAIAVVVAGRLGSPILGAVAGEQSGTSVALSANGHRVIIGSPVADVTGTDAGNARVFDYVNATWTQVGATLQGEAASDRSGLAVAISNDGMRVAVGAYLNNDGGPSAGSVRVFDLVGTTWTQVGADLDGPAGSAFGFSLALSASGSRLVVGAPQQNGTTGRMVVYDNVGAAWTQVGTTLTDSLEMGDSVDISGDGKRIAAGSPSADGSTLPGTVKVYELVATDWAALGPPILGENPGDNFGDSVALSGDGSTLVVGASSNTGGGVSGGGVGSGSVRAYKFAAGAWTQLGADLDGPAGFGSGATVSVSDDGTRLVSGAPESGGTLKLYTLSGATWMPAGPDFGTGARAGAGAAISPDGHTAAVGAPYAANPGAAAGEVRVYDLP